MEILVNTIPLPNSSLKTHRGGKSTRPASREATQAELRRGATLIVEEVDRIDENLGAFLNALSDEICAPTRFNLYLSAPGQSGYKLHCDTHDFFILQLAGQKQWKIFPPTTDSPLFYQKEHDLEPPPRDSIILECTLQQGDVLYVPRGFWHDALALREHSLHLTLAIFTRTGVDFLQWLVDELRDDVLFRRNLPCITKQSIPATETLPSPYEEHIGSLRSRLTTVFDVRSLAFEFHRYCVACQRKRLGFQLPSQLLVAGDSADGLTSAESFELVPQPHLLSKNARSGDIELVLAQTVISFSPNAEPILRYILSTPVFTKSDLLTVAGRVGWEQLLCILLSLAK